MRSVIIADDSTFMRNVLKGKLKGSEYSIIAEAKNGAEAIELYKKYLPDIVLLDITMPDVDGLSALKEIMSINSRANVVMCSAIATRYNVADAIKDGAKSFVVKPQFDSLIEILDKIFK